ncbi:MAG: dihydropteroate synthase [Gammaproteobacteria bacterium]|nr:MAG: dihydropteroate synthase [Gammaproteobacteria bacterium]
MYKQLQCGRFQLDLSRPQVMGILNVTPDSFSDGGRYTDVDKALFHVEEMLNDGADIIDIGAESTRPGAAFVDKQTELARLLPVIEAIQARFACCLSVDTNKPAVMREVLAREVDMINDVRGFVAKDALQTVAKSQAAICIMHMQGLPQSMQDNPHYQDVIGEVSDFLLTRAEAAVQAGITQSRITIDPGFGFGKTPEQNLLLLKHLAGLAKHYPVLLGLSRKSTLGVILGDDKADRTIASVTGALLAVQQGAAIVRVHDVRATVDALKVYHAVNSI